MSWRGTKRAAIASVIILVLLPVMVALPTTTGISVLNSPIVQAATGIMPSGVGNVTTSDATTDAFQLKTWTGQGLHWIFYYDNVGGVPSIECTAFPVNGIWSPPITIATNTNQKALFNSGDTFSTWYNYTTNVFYLVYVNNTELVYRYGSLSYAGCQSIAWNIPYTSVPIKHAGARWPTIAVNSQNNLWISTSSFDSNNYCHMEVWKDSSGTWSNVMDINTSSIIHCHSMILPLSSGSKWSLVYGDDSGQDPLSVSTTTNSGLSWSTPALSFYPTTAPFASAAAIGDTTFVLYMYGNNYYFYNVTINGQRGIQQIVASLTAINGSSISVNSATDEILVIYANNVSILYRVSTDGGVSFGAPKTICGPTGNASCGPDTFAVTASHYMTALNYTDLVWTNSSGPSGPYQLEYSGIGTSQLPTFTTTTTTSVTSNATVTSTNTIPTTITSGTCTDPEVTTTLTSTLTNTIVVTQTVVSSTTICGTTVSSSSNVSTSSTTASSSTYPPRSSTTSTTSSSSSTGQLVQYLVIGIGVVVVMAIGSGLLVLRRRSHRQKWPQ